jgi:peptide deformylase
MYATVAREQGVGIAAPQVGVGRKVILVKRVDLNGKPFTAYLNPVVRKPSKTMITDWEGCLSVPEGFGLVPRHAAITIEYDTMAGHRASERVEGYTARIFQHEMDHLGGVLFTERAGPGRLIPKDEYREMRKRGKSVAFLY